MSSKLMGTPQEGVDRIAQAFANRTVLITGGSGFMGKALVEKILRKCSDLKQLILLMRPKKGKMPKQRLEEMFNGPLFETVVKMRGLPYIMSKVTVVTGDTGEPALALSEEDRALCRKAEIIVHSAATVRFDEGLKKAIILNTRGTKYVLDLGKECPNLELFVHMSTAYCQPDTSLLEERVYDPPADPHEIIRAVETLDEATIDTLTKKMIGIYPNTYAFSKALSEALVAEAMPSMPAIILRPSVVVPMWMDPLPGWTDNINGPVGLLIGAGKGVLRTMCGDPSGHADFLPVDCAANILMATVWDYLCNGNKQQVMNLISSDVVKVTWADALNVGKEVVTTKMPFDNIVWYPGGGMTRYRSLHIIRSVLYHWLPAIFVDLLLMCLGFKPVLLRVHRRISKGFEVLEYYTNNQWNFKSDLLQQLRLKLNAHEREAYTMDSDGLDLAKYFENGMLAARRYILKEKDENLPRAKRIMKLMYVLHLLTSAAFYGFMAYLAYGYLKPVVLRAL